MAIQACDMIRFSRQMTRLYNNAFTPLMQAHGLTMREIHILLFLANNPQFDTAKDMVQRRGLLKSQVSQGVETLCTMHILTRVPDELDRRCIHLAITPTGQPIAKETQRLQNAWWDNLMGVFSPEEQAQTKTILSKWLQTVQTLEEQS